MLINFIDGYLEDIDDDTSVEEGCPTCNYGSVYTNYISLFLKKHTVEILVKNMYEFLLSANWWIELLCSNTDKFKEMTEEDFIKFIEDELRKSFGEFIDIYTSGSSSLDYGIFVNVKNR